MSTEAEHFTWVPKAQVSLPWMIADSWAGLEIRNKMWAVIPMTYILGQKDVHCTNEEVPGFCRRVKCFQCALQ